MYEAVYMELYADQPDHNGYLYIKQAHLIQYPMCWKYKIFPLVFTIQCEKQPTLSNMTINFYVIVLIESYELDCGLL